MPKIYTRSGDSGTTGLIGGERIAKSHPRVDAYGDLDELNSHLGLVLSLIKEKGNGWFSPLSDSLTEAQHHLFNLGSFLASPDPEWQKKLPPYNQDFATFLEQQIDSMEAELPALKSFILPGGHPIAAHLHISRTIARRAERKIVALNETGEHQNLFIRDINRLSDFLFVASRWVNHELGEPEPHWAHR